jgi:predicted nuclease of predicted toxin-antitoxin system
MKFLVDNQLAVALARYLADSGFDCQHAQDLGMETSDDRAISELAKYEEMVIVTKNEDFPLMADRQVGHSPQVVWVRVGNCRKASLLATYSAVLYD